MDVVDFKDVPNPFKGLNPRRGAAYWQRMSEGGRLDQSLGSVCYGSLRYVDPDSKQVGVRIFHPKSAFDEEAYRDFLKFLFTSRHWGDGFITKDVDEAKETGIVLNTKAPFFVAYGAAMATRVLLEYPSSYKTYKLFRSLGYDEEDSFFFATHIFSDDKGLHPIFQPTHGAVYPPNLTYKGYKEAERQEFKGEFSEGKPDDGSVFDLYELDSKVYSSRNLFEIRQASLLSLGETNTVLGPFGGRTFFLKETEENLKQVATLIKSEEWFRV